MRRIIVVVALLAVVGIAGFLYLFKREAVQAMYENARGYPEAKTPQESVDLFKKAIAARKYHYAAKYCTKEYAEQLRKAADAGKDLGTSIDDLSHRMKNDGVLTSEVEYILWLNDPMPPDLKLTVQSPGDKEATATVALTAPTVETKTKNWKYDPKFVQGFYGDYPLNTVQLVKEGGAWKINIPVSPAMRERFDRVVKNHMDYVNAFKKMSEEVRTERTTKVEVTARLEELLNEAVTAAK